MLHTYFAPHHALLDYVNHVVELNCDFVANDISPIYPFVPTHNRFLCFFLRDPVRMKKAGGVFEARARSLIIGPQLAPVMLDFGRDHQAVIVCLKPAGMYRLLGIPMYELLDRDYDASLVVGREIDELVERLQQARSPAERNEQVQDYLLGKLLRLKPALAFDLALLQQVYASGNLPIERVAALAGLSTRQVERLAHERLGMPPKLYSRMIRFSHAYKFKELAPHTTWTEIAYRCGYFDQMHFIRDFKLFAGYPPSMLTEADVAKSVLLRTMEDLSVSF